jgi:hypothetical protein
MVPKGDLDVPAVRHGLGRILDEIHHDPREVISGHGDWPISSVNG